MFKFLISLLLKYKKYTCFAVLFITLELILEIAVPFLMSFLMNEGLIYSYETNVFIGANFTIIYGVGISMVVCAILGFVFGILSSKYSALLGNSVAAKLREEEYVKIQKLNLQGIDLFGKTSLITRLTSDINTVQTMICNASRPGVRAPMMAVFATTFSFIMSWQLALIFILVMPVLALILFFIFKFLKPVYRKMIKLYDVLNLKVQENIIGIKTVKLYVKEEIEKDKFEVVNYELRQTSSKAFGLTALNFPMTQLCTYVVICLILYFSGLLHSMGLIEPGTITSFLSYVMQTMASIIMLSAVFTLFSKSEASLRRIKEVFDCGEIEDYISKKKVINNYDIKINNLTLSFENSAKPTLNSLSLEIKEGETIGIIGETGSGKTTLLNVLDRLLEDYNGTIFIGDEDIKSYDLFNYRQNVAFIPQHNRLFKDTIENNIKWGKKDASIEEIKNACNIACCDKFIEHDLKDGYQTNLSQEATNLSGGQRQRICIARSILQQPKILLLDDVTSALDRITEQTLIKNLNKELPKTTKIFAAQKISTIIDADKIIVLKNGYISNIGNHKELLKKDDLYKEIYNLQKEAGIL